MLLKSALAYGASQEWFRVAHFDTTGFNPKGHVLGYGIASFGAESSFEQGVVAAYTADPEDEKSREERIKELPEPIRDAYPPDREPDLSVAALCQELASSEVVYLVYSWDFFRKFLDNAVARACPDVIPCGEWPVLDLKSITSAVADDVVLDKLEPPFTQEELCDRIEDYIMFASRPRVNVKQAFDVWGGEPTFDNPVTGLLPCTETAIKFATVLRRSLSDEETADTDG